MHQKPEFPKHMDMQEKVCWTIFTLAAASHDIPVAVKVTPGLLISAWSCSPIWCFMACATTISVALIGFNEPVLLSTSGPLFVRVLKIPCCGVTMPRNHC